MIAEVYDGEFFDDTIVNLTVVISLNAPPTVDILIPEDGSTVEKTIKINGTANDLDGTVQLVEIRIDNVGSWLVCDGTDTWEFSLDTRGLSKGQHSIVARSFDGHSYSVIDSITINVDIDKDPPPPPPIPGLGEGDEAVLMSFILIIIIIIIVLAVIGFTVMKARERRRAEAEVKAIAEAEEAARQKEAAEKAAEPEDKGIDFEKYKFATPLALPAFTSEEEES